MVLCLVFHRFSVVLSLTRTDDIKRFLSLCCFESESTLCRMIKIQITLYTLVFACPATGSPSEILPNMALVFEVIYNAIVVRSRNKDILHGRRKKKTSREHYDLTQPAFTRQLCVEHHPLCFFFLRKIRPDTCLCARQARPSVLGSPELLINVRLSGCFANFFGHIFSLLLVQLRLLIATCTFAVFVQTKDCGSRTWLSQSLSFSEERAPTVASMSTEDTKACRATTKCRADLF